MCRTPIKYAEYKQELDSVYHKIHLSGQIIDGTMYGQLKKDVLESLIHIVLMDQYSRELGVAVDESEVRQTFGAAVARYPSENTFRQSLKTAGLTEADILIRLRRSLATRQVVQTRIAPTISVTDDEVKAYCDAHPCEFEHGALVHAAHILIKVNPLAEKETRQDAKQKIV